MRPVPPDVLEGGKRARDGGPLMKVANGGLCGCVFVTRRSEGGNDDARFKRGVSPFGTRKKGMNVKK